MPQSTIGIDISKAHLDVFRNADKTHQRFPNTPAGFRALARWIGPHSPRLIYEATGPYHADLELALSGKFPLVKVNPLQARRFAQATGTRTKTDAVDARILAKMGEALELVPDAPVSENQHEIKELQIARSALIKDRTRLKNRLKVQKLTLTIRHTKARLKQIDGQLKVLDAEIVARLNAAPETARCRDILLSIPGIGNVAAAAILIECPEIGTLGKKQIASLAGLAPHARQSGKWRGHAFIQGGRKYLRDALYMPALVATRFNPDMKRVYDRLKAAGKPAKVAITAVMRKLIILANALIREDREWTIK